MYGNRDTINVPVIFFSFLAISESNKSRDLSSLCMLSLGHFKNNSIMILTIPYSDLSRNTSSICRNIYRKLSVCLSACSCNCVWSIYLLWMIEIRLWSYFMFIEATNTESNGESKSCAKQSIKIASMGKPWFHIHAMQHLQLSFSSCESYKKI